MSIQTKIEQTAKEYNLYKQLFEDRAKAAGEIRKNLAEKALKIEDKEQLYGEIFDELGSVELLQVDTNQMKIRLYHYLKLAEDLVEIPQEIKEIVEDYKPTFLFTTTGEIANRELYEQRKREFIKGNIEYQNLTAKQQ
jgi:trans-2-enoyl-CoA reductase